MSGEVTPVISVIIPTYNRRDSLQATLESLARQTYPAKRIEVIVVDDGGSDDSEAVARRDYPFALRYLRQSNQGSAAARNRGAAACSGDTLVFLDDDMTLEAGYLAALAEKTLPGVITMGVWLPFEPPLASPFTFAVARETLRRARSTTRDKEVAFVDCASNNLAVRREDFARAGMWRDVLGDGPTLWGDVEFGYRAWRLGCRFMLVHAARIVHRDQHVMSLEAASARAYHVARIVQPLFALHPDIKPRLAMFRDKEPVAWGRDSAGLVGRKAARRVMSSSPVMGLMASTVPALERLAPGSTALRLLYRWIASGYLYRGYRAGLSAAREGTRAAKAVSM
jgi:glycosyltransferase involved in cell wall biosynthesis